MKFPKIVLYRTGLEPISSFMYGACRTALFNSPPQRISSSKINYCLDLFLHRKGYQQEKEHQNHVSALLLITAL